MAPSVVSQLRHFPGARLAARLESSLSWESLVMVILFWSLVFRRLLGAIVELESRCFGTRNGTRG